jgi:hypothetical protein
MRALPLLLALGGLSGLLVGVREYWSGGALRRSRAPQHSTTPILHRSPAAPDPPAAAAPGFARPATPNLLRNGDFQDDWITLLPETKNHHWCYASEFYNRRDDNPDGWTCRGSWEWPDGAPTRHMVLHGPDARLTQRVNWVAVHDDRKLEGFPDAGGFPVLRPQRSRTPLRLVRDLRFRVRLKGSDLAPNASTIEIGLAPPGGNTPSEPLGAVVPPTASASAPLPVGTFDWQWAQVDLPAAAWLQAAQAAAERDPKEAAEVARSGPVLPAAVSVSLHYAAPAGRIEIDRAELVETAAPEAPNLLANAGFEAVEADGYPSGWEKPVKYRYFPPRLYYLFNTWHNESFPNRGPVAADELVVHGGRRSLKMVVAAGDEKSVASAPIRLNQKEPRAIEVSAWVKTDRLCMLQLDAQDENGQRLDCFNFIHKAPVSIGTDDWRLVRQVFYPRAPVQSLRLLLCARGVNGYTLDDTGQQPQNNVVGTLWWDDLRLSEPESLPAELAARSVRPPPAPPAAPPAHPVVESLDLGERMLGDNLLGARLANPGREGTFRLRWEFTSPSGKTSRFESAPVRLPAGGRAAADVPYSITELCPTAYTEDRGTLSLLDAGSRPLAATELWFGTWTTPIDLELGALYLLPEQKQFVRMNLGLSAAAMRRLASVRLEIVRRGTGAALASQAVPATPAAIHAQHDRIPLDLREDLTNLLLADLDVAALPVQPFNDPQRNWFVRATALDAAGHTVATVESPPFCRQAHAPPQPAVGSVRIDAHNLLYVNNQPWMPWGAVYGHIPVYDGPADPGPGKYRDVRNLPGWAYYDRYTSATYTRARNDFNCLRYVGGLVTDPAGLEKRWREDNLYAATAFATAQPPFSPGALAAAAAGAEKLAAYLAFCKSAPMVVSTAPGIDESFGLFHAATPDQLKALGEAVTALRAGTGKPVMVGHGGYWNRLEWEKVPFFDIYDPETEPLYPANLHTDLRPLIQGQPKVAWLRPQMYEDVPYERWRFHAYVELMRGARGWQIAHGPGDASLFRGLHGELEFMKPIAYSTDPGPAVRTEPEIEHWSRRHGGKLYLIAATTHGLARGSWQSEAGAAPAGRSRVTVAPRSAAGVEPGPRGMGMRVHSIQYLPGARAWPAGTRLVQWVRLDAGQPPGGLALLLKVDGRWTHAAAWGAWEPAGLRRAPARAFELLRGLYPTAEGFMGFEGWSLERALAYLPPRATGMGSLPAAGSWSRLELPLEKVEAVGGLLDGIGFLHEGGRVAWGRTALVAPGGAETVVWGDALAPDPARLAHTRITIPGLKAGTKVRVLFEDRELQAGDGSFEDDFRGQDLYQRYGGGFGQGYGDAPVALHLYEIGVGR